MTNYQRNTQSGCDINLASAILTIEIPKSLIGEVFMKTHEKRLCNNNCAILLTFSDLPRRGSTWVLGSDATMCDIAVGALGPCASTNHVEFGFDEANRVVVRNLSHHGTQVRYKDQEFQTRRGTVNQPWTWILPAGEKISVGIHEYEFVISVPNHDGHEQSFLDNVAAFRIACISNSQVLCSTWGGRLRESSRQDVDEVLEHDVYIKDRDSDLGKGTSGSVCKYHNATTWETVAGKNLHLELDNTGRFVQRPDDVDDFMKEISILKRFSHDNIVRYIDVFQENQFARILMMEYCPGLTLEHQQGNKRLNMHEVLIMLQQCLRAIECLHLKGYTHRDIKPANILFRSREPIDVALADFGWSTDQVSSMYTFHAGSRYYNAPEMRLGQKFTAKVDIWALGLVAGEALTFFSVADMDMKQHPLQGTDYIEKMRMLSLISSKDQARDRSIALIRAMLSLDPKMRPTAGQCLVKVGKLLSLPSDRATESVPPTPAKHEALITATELRGTDGDLSAANADVVKRIMIQNQQPQVHLTDSMFSGKRPSEQKTTPQSSKRIKSH